MKTIRPPVKWHGGKRYLCHRIIEQFPKHRIYLEPFGGAASVLLNKEPCDVETYNDLDLRITRLFRVLREQSDEFVKRLRFRPYSKVEFKSAAERGMGVHSPRQTATDPTAGADLAAGPCLSRAAGVLDRIQLGSDLHL